MRRAAGERTNPRGARPGGVWVATLHAAVDLSEENLLHDIRSALAADDETSR